jgi:peptidoglycan hydrolase-like protein with peptidoglycan-binding domain
MRRTAAILLSLGIVIPAMAQAAAQKRVLVPAAQKAAPAKKAAAPTKKVVAQPAAKTAGAKKAVVRQGKRPKLAKTVRGRKAAPPASAPKPDPALIAAYVAMPTTERRALQSDLVWTGDYNGIISDDFGERSIAAVKSYQTRGGAAPTGILSAEQRTALAAAAKAKQEASGWRVMDDTVTGARLAIPIKHAPQASASKSGTRWSSGRGEVQIETFRIAEPGTTLAAVFEQQKKEPANREVEYSVLREGFFVISGLQGLKRFYARAHARDNEVRGFTIMYDQAMQGIMDPVAVAMSSRFEPFPRAAVGPPPKRKVEYATGIVIDGAGHIITDRQAADGCQVITLPGLGAGERIAEASDLALVRIYGARNLKPFVFAEDGTPAAQVTLVGIADPEAQGGGGVATAATVRVSSPEGGRPAIEPVPALGFSGAAALDRQGRLVGMALLNNPVVAGPSNAVAQAQLVPLEDIRKILSERNITVDAGAPSTVDAAKGSVVRVICVRK